MSSKLQKNQLSKIHRHNLLGILHREDGPALEYPNGHKEWWLNGQRHRENGPAVECEDGAIEYWLNGQTGPKIQQQVKENVARLHAEKEQQKLFDELSQDQDISDKMNTCFSKNSKKL